MEPAIFVFTDDETTSCVYVHECDAEQARSMIARTLTSDIRTPVSGYDPLEFSSVFVAANKRKPYDMLFIGEYDNVDPDEGDVNIVYEISPSLTSEEALDVIPIDMRVQETTEMWVLKARQLH